jgi:deazaflavin-dependent oxidoreductase (nitroreductase family)
LDRVFTRGFNPGVLKIAGRRWSPWAIVRHVGRRSGRAYATPVIAPRVTDDRARILVAYGVDTDWCRNVLAAGRCTLVWQGREYALVDPKLTEATGAWRLLRGARYLTARRAAPES